MYVLAVMSQSNFSLTDRGVDLTSTLTLTMAGSKHANNANVSVCMYIWVMIVKRFYKLLFCVCMYVCMYVCVLVGSGRAGQRAVPPPMVAQLATLLAAGAATARPAGRLRVANWWNTYIHTYIHTYTCTVHIHSHTCIYTYVHTFVQDQYLRNTYIYILTYIHLYTIHTYTLCMYICGRGARHQRSGPSIMGAAANNLFWKGLKSIHSYLNSPIYTYIHIFT